jgi:hypothetical protein
MHAFITGPLPVAHVVRTGAYTFFVRPVDAAGNTGLVYSRSFQVDGDEPTAFVESGR